MRTNRMAGLAVTVVSAVAGGTLVLGAAGPVIAAGDDHRDGRHSVTAPAADVDSSTLQLLAQLGQLTESTAKTVEQVQRAVADGGRLDPSTLPDVQTHLDAVGAAAQAKGKVKSMKAQDVTALAQAVAALQTELDALVKAGEEGDRAAVRKRASVTVAALVKVLSAAAVSGLVPAGQAPEAPADGVTPPELPTDGAERLPAPEAPRPLPTDDVTQRLPGQGIPGWPAEGPL